MTLQRRARRRLTAATTETLVDFSAWVPTGRRRRAAGSMEVRIGDSQELCWVPVSEWDALVALRKKVMPLWAGADAP